jgi:uncharacterized protein YjaZ
MHRLLWLPSLLIVVVGCQSTSVQYSAEMPPIHQIDIIPVYEGIEAYAAAMHADPEATRGETYRTHIIDDYPDCPTPTEIGRDWAAISVITNIDTIAKRVSVLQTVDIPTIVQTSLQRAAAVLPASETRVCIYLAAANTIPDEMNGIIGLTANEEMILIGIDPDNDAWADHLAYAATHEYHHTIAFSLLDESPLEWSNGVECTNLDRIVMEGLADVFAHALYPDQLGIWADSLSSKQEADMWQKVEPLLSDACDQDTTLSLLFGGDGFERWTGYTIGYHIAQRYVDAQFERGADVWLEMDSAEILRISGYNGAP